MRKRESIKLTPVTRTRKRFSACKLCSFTFICIIPYNNIYDSSIITHILIRKF
jgi:hypothetical protein